MTMKRIKTFRQYARERRQEVARKNEMSFAEVEREMPDSAYAADWRDYVVSAFNAGAEMPTSLWRTLDEGLQYRLLRSSRALKDNALTRKLREMTVPS